ncbi:hypothetical protein SanaruYs_28820 [Chryseotalea sanaruensis]|uniref:Uncharacterized protein n=1 Tax=Chryseotalea sanaruensis TaxID=2482724 RepID=A0A401UCN0_9BACT|nr:hypothetical protein [Chryseotalea sanaruensis]GCC52645.1 hypothetical protein SanaruYs_28820 [Chryseotalea sanaruensis]
MKTLYLIPTFIFLSFAVIGQSLSSLEDGRGNDVYESSSVGIFYRYTSNSGKYAPTVKGSTFNINVRKSEAGKGGRSWHFENPALGDIIWLLFNSDEVTNNVGQTFTSGLIGWHQAYWNVVAKDKLIIAPGFSAGDYIFGSGRDQGSPNILEPNGYYLYAGPAIKASYLLGDRAWIDGFFHWDITFSKLKNDDGAYQNIDGYKYPHFIHLGATVYDRSRFFAGIKLVRLVDRGINNDRATRFDFSLGYMINI